MRKSKALLTVFMAAVMALTVPFAVACKKNNNKDDDADNPNPPPVVVPDPVVTLDSVSLGTDGVQKTFTVDEPFNSEGLVVTATISTDGVPAQKVLTEQEYVVDSSEYDNTKVGVYEIKVSYTYQNDTKSSSYNVKVVKKDGLEVTLAENASDTYTLTETETSVEIDVSQIVVNEVTDNGKTQINNYSLEVYNADEVVYKDNGTQVLYPEDSETDYRKITVSEGGVYQIWAYADSSVYTGYKLSGFVLVNVVNSLVSITFNSQGAVTEQEESSTDSMTSTWKFTAHYANGDTKQLSAEDVVITGLDTKTVGENLEAVVSYTEDGTTQTVNVNYTITAKQAPVGDVSYTMTYRVKTNDATAKTGEWTTSWADENEDVGNNVTVTPNVSSYLTKSKTTVDGVTTYDDYVEVKAFSSKGITVNVGANASNASITVYVSHTSSTSARTAYLATATTADNAADVLDSKIIGGTDGLSINYLYTLTASDLDSGNYYVFTSGDTMHVYAIVVTYTVAASEDESSSVTSIDFTDTTKIGANATLIGADATDMVPITDTNGVDTGFYVTKCGSENKYTFIGTQNNVQCLQFQGTGTADKNSIATYVDAGTVTITMTYFNGSADRYPVIINSGLDTAEPTSDELTTEDKTIKTRTVTFELTERTLIYIGSKTSGLYVCSIEITVS